MNHLPHPQRPFKPLKIPYFEGPLYTPPFETFPARHGYDSMGNHIHGIEVKPDTITPLLQTGQSWSFFGLLQEFLDSAGVLSRLDGHTFLEDFLSDEQGKCLQEPEALADGWQNDDCLQHTDRGRTQAPKGYWKGVVENDEPRRFITTKRLWWYLDQAIRKLRNKTASDREQALKQLENRLYLSNNVAHLFDNLFSSTIVHSHDIPHQQAHAEDGFLAVSLSFHALQQALIQTRLILEARSVGQEIVLGSTLLARRMSRQGWCPYQAAWVTKSFTPVAGYYAAVLGPPMPLKCHIKCNDRLCHFLQIDGSQYEPKHDPTCGNRCAMVESDVDKISTILEDGGIPLISIRCHRGDSNVVRLEHNVHCWATGTEFYAISHVWSDGMGNPKKNALPACQWGAMASTALKARSAEVASPEEEEVWKDGTAISIWVDTLCVPLLPRARRLAIGRMKKTYSVATRVLVFDSALQQSMLKGTSLLELGYRILSCNWQRRLWTLQEAVFAPRLTFKFADGLLRFEKFQTFPKPADTTGNAAHPVDFAVGEMRPALEYFCSGQYSAELITAERLDGTARLDRFIGTIDHLCHRTTSRMSDEAICLATLLDANIDEILDAPATERFRRVIDHQRAFSSYTIFLDGPKIQEEPYRWAPATFMYPWNALQRQCFRPARLRTPNGQYAATKKLGTINASGFFVDLPGIFLCAPSQGMISGTDFFLWDKNTGGGRLLYMETVPEAGSRSGMAKPILTFEKDDNNGETICLDGSGPMATHAILMMAHLGAPMDGYKELTPTNLLGLLVSNLAVTIRKTDGQEQRVFEGRCETRVNVIEVARNPQLIPEHGRAIQDKDGNIKGYDISDKWMRCLIRKEGFLKWCIR